ncbi:MAG: RagB/SusD family nutrient uptake outer membrane protein [Bacteroidales bacterium]|nr:RagB/SusD family nutrient uptake outer membrane protein [Bacteroidales bacterium]
MNILKIHILAILAVALTVTAITSCSKDFLDEELKTKRDYEYFSTEEGVQDAIISLYRSFRYPFTFEQGFTTTEYGVDHFTVGGDRSNSTWNDYTSNLSSAIVAVNINTTMIDAIWDNMYKAISMANMVLASLDEAVEDETAKKLYKAEALFTRAYSYFTLVQQYGGVVLKLEPSEGVDRHFARSSREECVNRIITDLRDAYADLPAEETEEGRLYKDVAAHFLAKALLYRCSEINDDWNSSHKTADLAEIITLADEVIAKHDLAPDFRDVFAFTKSDDANERLPEIIFAAQFSDANSAVEGNAMHLYFLSQYMNLTGLTRDIAGGREYQRTRTSDYIYDVFDLENDSRFWKSFRTKQNLNNAATAGQLSGKDGSTIDSIVYTYAQGDLGLIYLINKKGDTRFNKNAVNMTNHTGVYYLSPYTGKPVPHAYCRYYSDSTDHLRAVGLTNRFPSLNKWLDGARPTHNHTEGSRDGIIARVAETYLIKAEALIRQEKFADAIVVINEVRDRAAFKEGEDRAAYTDGGVAYETNSAGQSSYPEGILRNSHAKTNSYYESLSIAEATAATTLSNYTVSNLPAEDEAIITKLGYTSDYDRMMCFLLNERSRELVGEFHRWMDLARTKTLINRAKAFNPEAAPNIAEKHYVRPIPQTFLDRIYNDQGKPLTTEEKQAMQNPGY